MNYLRVETFNILPEALRKYPSGIYQQNLMILGQLLTEMKGGLLHTLINIPGTVPDNTYPHL